MRIQSESVLAQHQNDQNKKVKVAPKKTNNDIERGMQRMRKNDNLQKKLLLLGAGSSGKSTLFKQLKSIHGWDFKREEYMEARHNIRQNLVLSMLKLLQKNDELFSKNVCSSHVDLDDITILECVKYVAKYRDQSFEFIETIDDDDMELLSEHLHFLWNLDSVKETYLKRGSFAIPDNMDFFFEKVKQIFQDQYYPTTDDLIKTRIRTTGMIECHYQVKDVTFNVYDVGGQRNERKKWIHSFANVTAVVFVVALNHYDAVCFEDEEKNSMQESIELFSEVTNSKWFKKTEMILFLNKDDLFQCKIRDGISLKVCFDDWDGPVFDETNENENENDYDNCYVKALEYIESKYLEVNGNQNKRIFTHVTDATNRDQIEKVFWDVQDIVIRSNLRRGGFV